MYSENSSLSTLVILISGTPRIVVFSYGGEFVAGREDVLDLYEKYGRAGPILP